MSETTTKPKDRTRTPSKRFSGVYSYSVQDGRKWGATVELERDWRTGRRIVKRKQGFRTQEEARDWRVAELDKRRRGDTVEPSLTPFGQYAEEWLAGQTMRPPSLQAYRNRLSHVTAKIGHVPLSRVTTAMLDRVTAELLAAGYAPGTAQKVLSAARAVFRQAMRHRMIAANPAELARVPESVPRDRVTWTPEQMGAFLAATAADPFWHVVFRFMAETWVRIGEMIDLRWDAVDLAAGTVRIERTVTRDAARKRVSGDPKSATSRRTIPVSAGLTDLLRQHRDRQRFAGGSDLVFPGQRTGRWMQQPAVAYALLRYCQVAGVPELTPHGLRHVGGSLAYAAGVPLKVISERMGHANMTVTANIYTHVDAAQHRSAADEIGRLLSGSQ